MSWTARTTIATERRRLLVAGMALLAGHAAWADVRDHVRLKGSPSTVTQAQAGELSLAMGTVAARQIQTLVRLRATRTPAALRLEARAAGADAPLLRAGQRARVFTLRSRSQMVQARIEHLAVTGDAARLQLVLATPIAATDASDLLVEIVVERGEFLSVPNDALIEEGTHRIVYVKNADGDFEAREVQVGIQGETYSAVAGGVVAGEQVVTTGSFFIDADYKLKGGG